MKWYCLGFCFTPDFKKVFLISKLKPQWQSGLLNGVGGKIENNETALEAMYREFEEETGLKTKCPDFEPKHEWNHFATMRGPDWCVVCFFNTWSDLDTKYGVKSMTEEQVGIYDVSALPKSCISNISWLVAMAQDHDLKGRPLEITYPGANTIIV